jgi:hypothetical protein
MLAKVGIRSLGGRRSIGQLRSHSGAERVAADQP